MSDTPSRASTTGLKSSSAVILKIGTTGGVITAHVSFACASRVIELFGEPFHNPELGAYKVGECRTESGRTKAMAERGYDLLVIWSKELTRKDDVSRHALIEKIKRFNGD